MTVTLEQIIGRTTDEEGKEIVTPHGMDKVMFNDIQVGVIHRKINAKLIFLPTCPEVIKNDVLKEVTAIREGLGEDTPIDKKHHTPPPLPQEILDEFEGEEDDDDNERDEEDEE